MIEIYAARFQGIRPPFIAESTAAGIDSSRIEYAKILERSDTRTSALYVRTRICHTCDVSPPPPSSVLYLVCGQVSVVSGCILVYKVLAFRSRARIFVVVLAYAHPYPLRIGMSLPRRIVYRCGCTLYAVRCNTGIPFTAVCTYWVPGVISYLSCES